MKSSPSHISQVIGRIRAAWTDVDSPRRVDDVHPRRATHPRIRELAAHHAADDLPLVVRWPYMRH